MSGWWLVVCVGSCGTSLCVSMTPWWSLTSINLQIGSHLSGTKAEISCCNEVPYLHRYFSSTPTSYLIIILLYSRGMNELLDTYLTLFRSFSGRGICFVFVSLLRMPFQPI